MFLPRRVVVRPERRRDVHDSRAVLGADEVLADNRPAVLGVVRHGYDFQRATVTQANQVRALESTNDLGAFPEKRLGRASATM